MGIKLLDNLENKFFVFLSTAYVFLSMLKNMPENPSAIITKALL